MSRFWCSWYQPGEDYRPITYPPPPNILGWWKSGETDEAATLCAVVEADNAVQAIGHIRNAKAWPEANDFRFADRAEDGWIPGDRFPLSDWMKPRFGVE